MTTVEITRPTTVRELLFDEETEAEIAVSLAARLPPAGLVARTLGERRHLPRSAVRALNSRVLVMAVAFLGQDVAGLMLSGLSTCRALVEAAEETSADPDQDDEVVVHLTDPYAITCKERPHVDLLLDDQPVGSVSFELDVSLELCGTSAAVRRGAVVAIECDACSVAVTLGVEGCERALLTRRLEVPVRLTVDPPVAVPVGYAVPVPRPPVPAAHPHSPAGKSAEAFPVR